MPEHPAFARSIRDQAYDLVGTAIMFDPSGTLWLPLERTLIVADLHLEKGSSFASRGVFLPPFDTRETASRLAQVIERLCPRRVIALGDSFHDRDTDARMSAQDRTFLKEIIGGVKEWIWVEGNHDPQPPAHLGGDVVHEIRVNQLNFRHEPRPGQAGSSVVAGHLHPCARIRGRLRHPVRRRCFALGKDRLVMPSFGAYTGGLNVCDPAFRDVFGGKPGVIAISAERVFPIAPDAVCPD
jgi:uncharacterized protein